MTDEVFAASPSDAQRLLIGEHHDPHSILGIHPTGWDKRVLRAFHPDANGCEVVHPDGSLSAMQALGDGLFCLEDTRLTSESRYRLRFHFEGGTSWERGDPYVFWPTLGEQDLYLFGEGTHRRLYDAMGARYIEHQGVRGTAFSVWAPNARRVSVVGDFCSWDGRLLPMRSLGSSGVWELFVPGVEPGALYKFEIKTQGGELRVKTDPMARRMQMAPDTASIVHSDRFVWGDQEWMRGRRERDHQRSPVNIYEMHLGSWARDMDTGKSLSYRSIAKPLVEHVKRLGFTHVEFMPLAEHAYYPSWGYQVTGYYAPTARYGAPEDLKYLVDYEGMTDTFMRDAWIVNQTFLPEGMLGHRDSEPFSFDPKRAKELLAEAGYEDGFSISVNVATGQERMDTAQAIQASFAQGGIELEILPSDARTALTTYRAREHDIYLGTWGIDYFDPATNAVFVANEDNSPEAAANPLTWRNAWQDEELTARVQELALERDEEARNEGYQELITDWQEVSPFIMLFQQVAIAAVRPEVKNFSLAPTNDGNRYHRVSKE